MMAQESQEKRDLSAQEKIGHMKRGGRGGRSGKGRRASREKKDCQMGQEREREDSQRSRHRLMWVSGEEIERQRKDLVVSTIVQL